MGPTRVKSVMKSGGGALSKILWRMLVPALGLVCGVIQIC